MNVTELKKILPILTKHKIVPMLWGSQGIGKTQVVKQIAKENGYEVIHLHLATQEVGDLVGLLVHNDDGTVTHARPEWFPTSGRGIIYLDEINRAMPEVLQSMFSFVTEGTIHRHKLPDEWRIVAAGNYQNNSFNVTDTSDAAWVSRFCHIDFKPEVAEFITYADKNKAFSVASFIRDNPQALEQTKENSLDKSFIVPSRRSFLDMIARLETEDLGSSTFEVYSGIIGTSSASAFLSHKAKAEKGVSLSEIMEDYDKVKSRVLSLTENDKDSRFDLLGVPVDELLTNIKNNPKFLKDKNKEIGNLIEFISDLPKELVLKTINSLTQIDNFNGASQILSSAKIVDKIKKGKSA